MTTITTQSVSEAKLQLPIKIGKREKKSKEFMKEYMKNYLKAYREQYPDYYKNYYEQHKEKMKRQITEKLCEKVLCECGKEIMRGYLKKHTKTALHNKLMNKQ